MGIRDVFHFNEQAYTIKVRNTDSRILRKKHHSKVRLCHAGVSSVVWGIGLVPATFGISLFGWIYTLRQIDVLRQQAKLIEREIERRGLPIPRCRKRDLVFGMLIGATGIYVGIWIGQLILHLVDPVTGGLASVSGTVGTHAVPLTTSEAAHFAASDFPNAAHGAVEGVTHVFATELHHVYHDMNAFAANTTLLPPSQNVAFLGGEQLAVTGMNGGESHIGNAAAQFVMENRIYNAEHPNRNC